MSYGFGFLEILVSEVTMILACILVVICIGLLGFYRKKLSAMIKAVLTIIFIITTIYLMFIAWLVIGFGSH